MGNAARATQFEEKGEAELRKLEVGELIKFEDIAYTRMDTRFGEGVILNFADADGKIFRKCWAQGGMMEWLKQNPTAKSIVLKKKLMDGELTYNVWAHAIVD